MAMDIIKKDKKEIVWLGLPNDLVQDLELCKNEKLMIQNRIVQKKKTLQEYIMRVNIIFIHFPFQNTTIVF